MESAEQIEAVLKEFKHELVNQHHEFMEFKYLYYGSKIRIDLLNEIAKHFFRKLCFILLERLVLNVSKLTDPVGGGQRKNLSLDYVHELFSVDPRYPLQFAKNLIQEAKKARKHVALWRNKLISHKDLDTALGKKDAGELVPSEIGKFYDLMQNYIEAVNQAFGKGPYPINTVAHDGASDLVSAMKRAVAFDELFKRDPAVYDVALNRIRFKDA